MNLELDNASEDITLIIDGQEHILDIAGDVGINDLDEDMREHPGLLSWYTRVAAAARARVRQLEAELKACEGRFLEDYLSDQPRLAYDKAKMLIRTEDEWMTRVRNLTEAQHTLDRLDGAVTALGERGWMLRSLGARDRTEMEQLDITTKADRMREVMGTKR